MAGKTSIATTITGPDGKVSGRLVGSGPTGILLAHGAGTNQDHPFMTSLRDGLAGSGHTVMTFNYPYTERGSKRPDRAEILLRCHRAAADHLAARVDRLFLAGRSMGGRIATYLVAEGFGEVGVPLLFFQGTSDALSRMELFDRHIRALPNATVELLEGASHSFRGKGWTEEAMMERLVNGTTQWIASIPSGTRSRRRP
jgi:predicted alpha/beta-hydrolase family hydrolase